MKSAIYLILRKRINSRINNQIKTNKRLIINVSNVLAMLMLKVRWLQMLSCWHLASHYLRLFQVAIFRFSAFQIAPILRAHHLKPLNLPINQPIA